MTSARVRCRYAGFPIADGLGETPSVIVKCTRACRPPGSSCAKYRSSLQRIAARWSASLLDIQARRPLEVRLSQYARVGLNRSYQLRIGSMPRWWQHTPSSENWCCRERRSANERSMSRRLCPSFRACPRWARQVTAAATPAAVSRDRTSLLSRRVAVVPTGWASTWRFFYDACKVTVSRSDLDFDGSKVDLGIRQISWPWRHVSGSSCSFSP